VQKLTTGAYFDVDAVYGQPKPRFSVYDELFSSAPFGAYMSLDGVHPNAQGQDRLVTAAAQAINARYGLSIP
jgi:lysophospholipase L1-like esterase